MNRTKITNLALFATICTACTAPAFGQEYSLTPLGFLPNNGVDGSWSWGLSESGLVSGEATSINAPAFAEAHVWDSGVMTGLGNLTNFSYHSRGMDVNDSKEVCGWGSTPQGWQAFEWTSTSGMVGLGYVGAYPTAEGPSFYSVGTGNNQAGQITGASSTTTHPFEAFLWGSGSYQQMLGFLPGDTGSVGEDINNASPVQVTGASYGPTSVRAAFLWDNFGGMVGLTTPGSNIEAAGLGLNDGGDVAGWSDTEAYGWFASSGYVPTSLGSLGGFTWDVAWDINNHQQIVGTSDNSGARAFIWDSCNLMRDLNLLVDASGTGWTLWYARGINDAGQIAGWGRNPNGDIAAFLLDPITGACCTTSGCVEDLTEADCLCVGSMWFGPGSACDDAGIFCQVKDGACCHGDTDPPFCTLTTHIDCDTLGGVFFGDGSLCVPGLCIGPDDPTGACCRDDGTCTITTFDDCAPLGGTYFGDGSTCDPNPCIDPADGACCVEGPVPGTTICIIMSAADCDANGGTYFGDGSLCTPDLCDPMIDDGACCIQITCVIMTAADCAANGGTYFGDGSNCTPGLCDDPTQDGACCIQITCVIMTAADCAANGGTYFGNGSVCSAGLCDQDGACCVPGALCFVTFQTDCLGQGGTFFPGQDCTTVQCQDPVGACCRFDQVANLFVCFITSESNCLAQGGTYQGDGTSCTPDPCNETGACCHPGVPCYITTQADCEGNGGVYFGDGSDCTTDPCADPGACCVEDPGTIGTVCVILSAADCQAQGGAYFGDGSSCTPDPCNPPNGACCIEDPAVGFVCIITTAADCQQLGGTYYGDGSSCTPSPCPNEGACCVEGLVAGTYICVQLTFLECEQQNGIYQGDGVPCTPDPCPPPTGACCYEDAAGNVNCIVTTMLFCEAALGGTYLGDFTPCVPNPCGPPSGACCIKDQVTGYWICVTIPELECELQGGIYYGDATLCAANQCPQPVEGACCLQEDTILLTCIVTTNANCDWLGGQYQGDGVPCTPDPCPETGACCLECVVDGCIELTEIECIDLGGYFLGIGTPCDEVQCPLPCGLNLSTGTTGVSVDPLGAADPDWFVVSHPFGGLGPVYSIAPVSAWTTTPGANWIDPYNTGGSTPSGFDPVGNYVFRIQFFLDLSTQSDFELSLDVASDNASQYFLNGCAVGSTGSGDFGSLTSVYTNTQSCFVDGLNVLEAQVTNDSIWMGLLVEGKVTWRNKVADLSTGTTNGVPDPFGSADPDWTIVSYPTGGAGPVFSNAPVSSYATLPGANWIDPYGNPSTNTDPGGTYVYQVQFNLDFATQNNFELAIETAVDNNATYRLNGNLFGSAPTHVSTTLLGTTNQAFFVDGLNTLTVVAINFSDGGPTGLMVDGCVTAGCRDTDCNGNGIHDFVDIMSGISADTNFNGIPDECECDGDTNGDGVVDIDDLINVILDWGTNGANNGGDVNGDGFVDVDDLVLIILNFGPCQ